MLHLQLASLSATAASLAATASFTRRVRRCNGVSHISLAGAGPLSNCVGKGAGAVVMAVRIPHPLTFSKNAVMPSTFRAGGFMNGSLNTNGGGGSVHGALGVSRPARVLHLAMARTKQHEHVIGQELGGRALLALGPPPPVEVSPGHSSYKTV